MEIIFNVILAIFISAYLFLSLQLDKGSVAGDVFGAGGFPIVIAVIGPCNTSLHHGAGTKTEDESTHSYV